MLTITHRVALKYYMCKHLLAVAALSFALTGFPASISAARTSSLQVLSEGRGTLHRADPTVQFVVRSKHAGRDFLVQITPPISKPWLPGQRAPVAYVLDGGYGIFAPAALLLGGSRATPPLYVVTIQYPAGQRGSRDWDMLFADAVRPGGSPAKGGGAANFLAFLLKELRPFVEARYPVDPVRSVLVGHSLSGVFTANVLARQPEAFAGYLIASPSVWADPDIDDRLSKAALTAAPRRVFIAYGAAEAPHMVRGGRRVARAVTLNRAAFASRTEVFANADHISFYPELVARGLGHLLPQKHPIDYPEELELPASILKRYEGQYVLSDGRRVEVSLKGERLVAGLAEEVELSALPAPGRFYVDGYNAELTFEGPTTGPADLLRIRLNGDEALARRADDP